MTESELSNLILRVLPIVDKAATFIKNNVGRVAEKDIEVKSSNSLVSYVDKQTEKLLVAELGSLLPAATFLTEEDTVENDRSDLVWIIDPLDGTTNFLQNIPFFSVSVALEYQGEMCLGVVQSVLQGETFYAWTGGGAYCNAKRINVSHPTNLGEVILATGFPYAHRTAPYLNAFQEFLTKVQGARRLGSAALDLAYVAAGRFDAFYEFQLNIWDVAAGAIIVSEAGGEVVGFYDDDGWKNGQYVLAAPPTIIPQLREVLTRHRP